MNGYLQADIRVDGIGEGDLVLQAFLGAKMHKDLIFDTSGGIGCQSGAFAGIKAGNAFDESDGPDGDQVFLIGGLRVVFF